MSINEAIEIINQMRVDNTIGEVEYAERLRGIVLMHINDPNDSWYES